MQFTQGLERAVQHHPDVTATICRARSQTFAELYERVTGLAGCLASRSLAKGARIAVLALNSDHYLEVYLATAWAGGVIVPVNFRWSPAEIAYSLNDAGCVALMVDQHHAALVPTLREQCPGLQHIFLMGGTEESDDLPGLDALIAAAEPLQNAGAGGDDLLGIFYTGGTTGRPKGVMLSHANLCSSGLSMLAEGVFNEGAVGLHVAPMFHLADMLLTTCLVLRGCTHVMLPTFSPDAVLDHVARFGVTDTLVVPAMLQAIVDHPAIGNFDTSSLCNILYGASPASETLLRRTMAAFPGVRLTQGYGMTESAAFICALPWHQHVVDNDGPNRLRAAGRSTFDVHLQIVDPEDRELPCGEIGEIIVKGPNVMQGYYNMPEATAETLRGGWLHTGDMAWMDEEGYVFIVDRAKDMIISGGENIYSAEVENAVASHPAVAANAVIGIPHEQMGEAVHVALVLRPGSELSLEALQAHCRALIAGYKVPRSMEVRPSLPLSGAGKILKTELREPFWKGRDRAVG
ncbi:class I adenylate-forming enzyme family protein [Novosphingobium sp. AAP93]|uniref:class I adenylate-forming enzyme family protein n=1 Tax=Novosphingobium sp. AAP93 TaxID=1523427 RepID=UPI0006B9FA0D|nr:long-chain fatty acid--CoA ligase [Novosphingobium sp. AAP93]KPF80193.1 fatty-acid--CoA ligase [Novosphingobium sp. AAP93]